MAVLCAGAAAIVVLVGFLSSVGMLWVEISSPPVWSRLDPEQGCPSDQAQHGLVRYAFSEIWRAQAIKSLIQNSEIDYLRHIPSSLVKRTVDYYRMRYLTRTLSPKKVSQLTCVGPIFEWHKKRLSGIPSLASEILNKDIDQISAEETFLIACGAFAADRRAGLALLRSGSATELLDNLRPFCHE